MSDLLLENVWARKAIKSLGLPLPVPEKLKRSEGAYEERPLEDLNVVCGAAAHPSLLKSLARTVATAGGNPHVLADDVAKAFEGPGQAWGRPAKRIDLAALPERFRPHALVFDATGLADADGLRALYDFFHPLVPTLGASGRVVVLARSLSATATPEAAAAQQALEGFIKALGREVGRRGSTANLLVVDAGAEERVDGPLRFLLSARSAFVSGQPIRVSTSAKSTEPAKWTRPLEGKVALVTGAARGIGEATAQLLAAQGAHVVCLDRAADAELAAQVARALKGSVLLCDVSAPDAAAQVAKELKEKHGGVDIVVHNAGVTRDKTLARMSPEQWDGAVGINLGAVTKMTKALLDGTGASAVLREGGRIVCLSSVAGIAGNMGQTNYSASKAGLVGYVHALSKQVAGRGITVNAIAPGFIETRLTHAIPVMIREVGRRLSNLGQGGLPQDVAEAITFLATPGAVGVTGTTLRVCGGAYIGA